jgi:hypothetical protein
MMSKRRLKARDNRDLTAKTIDALIEAQKMPPGPERNKALEKATHLRHTQIILATLAPYSGERNFYEICRALPLTHAPTEWRPTHAPSTSGSDSPEAGAPETDQDDIPECDRLFLAFKSAVLELERLAERADQSARVARLTLEALEFERESGKLENR